MIPCTETLAANEASSPEEAALDSHQPPGLPETGPKPETAEWGPRLLNFFKAVFYKGGSLFPWRQTTLVPGQRGSDRGLGPGVS